MNPILNDPLVLKYFGCPGTLDCMDHSCVHDIALRVLDAMCAPIKVNEKYLYLGNVDSVGALVEVLMRNDVVRFHPSYLRLPDSFQEPDYEKEIEARIDSWANCPNDCAIMKDLVCLARKAERQKMERERK